MAEKEKQEDSVRKVFMVIGAEVGDDGADIRRWPVGVAGTREEAKAAAEADARRRGASASPLAWTVPEDGDVATGYFFCEMPTPILAYDVILAPLLGE